MTIVTGIVLYVLIWWVALFVVLPIGARPVQAPDETSGWRGAPARPRFWRTVGLTTALALIVWLLAFALIQSDWISFRHGLFAAPDN